MNNTVEDVTIRRPHAEHRNRDNWEIDQGLIADYHKDFTPPPLPNTLSRVDEIDFITDAERRLLSQIQSRTYLNMFALIEGLSHSSLNGTNTHDARLTATSSSGAADSEYRQSFQQTKRAIEAGMPVGYRFSADVHAFQSIISKLSDWSVLAFSYHIGLTTQAHYKQSAPCDADISLSLTAVILNHWRDTSRHAIQRGIEWGREDAIQSVADRDQAVDDLVLIFRSLDEILQAQAEADLAYFLSVSDRAFGHARSQRILGATLAAYRWQFIFIGLGNPRYVNTLMGFLNEAQYQRISDALGSISDRGTLH